MSQTPPNGVQISLRVIESLSKDVGRGIARIDFHDMQALGVQPGDVIRITGKKTTVAKVMAIDDEFAGKKFIQIDGITRENSGVGIDERVTIERAFPKPASQIVLAPLTELRGVPKKREDQYIGKLIEGLPLVQGDRIRINLFGAGYHDFSVVETIPGGEVTAQPYTSIRIKLGGTQLRRPGQKVSYEDIGGLNKEIQRVREMIELPLKYPQVFDRLGIGAPKGLLLHGPPGTGKTLIARAVANETEAHFIAINGPEVIHKFYGESEARLREIFEEAKKKAPSIIFIDEIDAISPRRETVQGDVEKRVVAQLLALMDGLEARGQIVVIGATNIPNAIDPALRRPGRFDREIAIGIPDKRGRLEILEIHTRGMPLAPDVKLEELANITHGFVGADLEALCREAAMLCLRKALPQIEFETDSIPYETLLQLQVTMDDFMEAFKEIDPSAIRELYVELPEVGWEKVGGLGRVKQELIEAIEWPLRYPEMFEHLRIQPAKGILLYGPSGTGKTLLAKAVATESQANFISVKGPALLSKYVGESERAVRELFRKAKQASPCIIFFDEIDAVAPIRGSREGDSHVTERVISQLLTELDGIEDLRGVIVLAATNRIEAIDPALLTPGRFELLLEVPRPSLEERIEIFTIHTRGKPLAADVDFTSLAARMEGCVGADIEAVCRKAARIAMREFLAQEQPMERSVLEKIVITQKHFERALGQGS
ncbi:MAG: AAA family ATPase [Nitrospinota bacterium]|nr:MAG: AAA family ATPase [Nitrospinota bacterium]